MTRWRYGQRNLLLVALAGTKHGDARLLPNLPPGTPVELVRDPGNQYDKNAIGVLVRLGDVARMVKPENVRPHYVLGHIPAKKGTVNWAAAMAPIMDAGGKIIAVIQQHRSNAVVIEIAAPAGTSFDELEVKHANPLPR